MYSTETPDLTTDGERKALMLPEPAGYKLLVALARVEKKTEGGIIRPDELVHREETATILGFVLKLGPLAYQDPAKFATGPWCKEGQWVVFKSYSGTRLTIFGQEFRLINDDSVEAVVEDPRGVGRL